jgi:protein-S-isoprenylcysteine O-methyltransferase Ste14
MGKDADAASAAGAPIPPPVLFFAAILAGFGIRHFVPFPIPVPEIASRVGGALLIVAGAGLGLAGTGKLVRGGTTPFPHRPSSALVESGAYGFSRNPIYLSMAVLLAGAAILLRSGWHLAMTALLVAVLDRTQIPREERYLEARFGDAYRAYARRVRRWL